MTHYDTLGISENASQDEIKKAYRKLANQHHPDKGGDTTQFQKIQAAYDSLGDEQKRAQYDAERRGIGGFRFSVNGHDMGGAVPPEMEEMLRNFGFGFSFGPGFASHSDPFTAFRSQRKNKDIQLDISINLASTLENQTKIINVKTTNGSNYPVEVNIPRGVRQNSTIKYSGLGDDLFTSLPRGDLFVRISIEPNEEFGVHNLDLIKQISINCIQAMTGYIIQVNGLDGKTFDVNIPPGTQPNSKFRIPNQGLYAMDQNFRGALIIILSITIPVNLTLEQKQLLQNTFPLQ